VSECLNDTDKASLKGIVTKPKNKLKRKAAVVSHADAKASADGSSRDVPQTSAPKKPRRSGSADKSK
jgi:hypothetical protein